MTEQRCPNCQALNAEQAGQCSLCGEALAAQVDDEDEVRYGRAGRPERRPEPAEPSPADAGRPPATVPPTTRPAPGESHPFTPPSGARLTRVGRPPWAEAAGVGALAGAVLALLLAGLGYGFLQLRIVPLIGRLFYAIAFLPAPPAVGLGSLPALIGCPITGAATGAVLGLLAVFLRTERSALPPAFLVAVAFAALAAGGSGGQGGQLGLVFYMIRGAVSGFVFGYVIWLILCGYLAAIRTRHSD